MIPYNLVRHFAFRGTDFILSTVTPRLYICHQKKTDKKPITRLCHSVTQSYMDLENLKVIWSRTFKLVYHFAEQILFCQL